MGRTSKFSFPIPGRKRPSSKDASEPQWIAEPMMQQPAVMPPIREHHAGNLTKAQRVLGLDSSSDATLRNHSGEQWTSSRSSAMSISISESTISNEDADSHVPSDHWDQESGVFPQAAKRLQSKASSTVLGRGLGDIATEFSDVNRWRIRSEPSTSTLMSHYDRQQSPLAISQQTSASSARDRALRKGFVSGPVPPRTPLMYVEEGSAIFDDRRDGNYNGVIDQQFDGRRHSVQLPEAEKHFEDPKEKKKPTKLDLSLLFPFPGTRKKQRALADDVDTPTSMLTNVGGSMKSRCSIFKKDRHLLPSPAPSNKSDTSPDERSGDESLYSLYDHYGNLPGDKSPHMSRIPEYHTSNYYRPASVGSKTRHARDPRYFSEAEPYEDCYTRSGSVSDSSPQQSSSRAASSWQNVRASMTPTLSTQSTAPTTLDSNASRPDSRNDIASLSSRRSRSSRRTNATMMSNSDLLKESVLSLSSDSEDGEDSDPDLAPLRPQASLALKPSIRAASSRSSPPRAVPPETKEERLLHEFQFPMPSQHPSQPQPFSKHPQFDEFPMPQSSQNTCPPPVPPKQALHALKSTLPQRSLTSRKGSGRAGLVAIPESRDSGPWHVQEAMYDEADFKQTGPSSKQKHDRSSSLSSQHRQSPVTSHDKKLSISSVHSISSRPKTWLRPMPPYSHIEAPEIRESAGKQGRTMIVTKQEELLLEALRQKRAKMREKIIEDYDREAESAKNSPPSTASLRSISRISQLSISSTTSTIRADGKRGDKLSLLLNAPIARARVVETTDLNELLSYGDSDDDSAPVTPAPGSKNERQSSSREGNPARLSAVGQTGRPLMDNTGGKKSHNVGVRFVGEATYANQQEVLSYENGIRES